VTRISEAVTDNANIDIVLPLLFTRETFYLTKYKDGQLTDILFSIPFRELCQLE